MGATDAAAALVPCMTAQILVDTNILIDVSRGFEPTIELLKREGSYAVLYISVTTQMELIIGCKNKQDLNALASFLDSFQVASLNQNIATRAVSLLQTYYLSHGLLIVDALIAATALENQLLLLTRNQKDFRFINGLSLVAIDVG
jgi:predicted nucleic acid-binding protein